MSISILERVVVTGVVLVTVTTYSVTLSASVTVIVIVFSPLAHVGDVSFSIAVPFTSIAITAEGSFVTAVILFVVLVVITVYSKTSLENDGLSVKEPIVNADRELSTTLFLLQSPKNFCQRLYHQQA